jgi:hypothetical protein
MASNPAPDLELNPITGVGKPLRAWLTTFHLTFVAVDPYAEESRRLLDTAGRILDVFQQADTRVAFLCTSDAVRARAFLGKRAEETLVFTDPDRTVVKAFGLSRLPAFVHVAMDGTVAAAAEGWDPPGWQNVADGLAQMTRWRAPVIPSSGDPAPFVGAPAA